MADVDGDRIICAERLFIPDLLIDLIDGEHFAFVLEQKEQDVVFDTCQTDTLSAYRHFLLVIINDKAAAAVYIGMFLRLCDLSGLSVRSVPFCEYLKTVLFVLLIALSFIRNA